MGIIFIAAGKYTALGSVDARSKKGQQEVKAHIEARFKLKAEIKTAGDKCATNKLLSSTPLFQYSISQKQQYISFYRQLEAWRLAAIKE